MPGRRTAAFAAALIAGGAFAATATAADAPSGPPPPPAPAKGVTVTQFADGLMTPTSFAFGAGAVFEGDGGNVENGPPNGGAYVIKNGKATKLAGSPQFVGGMTWHRGTLYLSGGSVTGPKSAKWQILAWSHWNGTTFTKRRVVYTAPKKFDGFNGVAVGPDGRLYVGADVGLTDKNDHGPAKTPYVYDILSMKTNGKGLKVFASGIRQPWQMVFAGRSRTPLVSDLGQDSGAKNPPDFILKVREGDDYGFPQCNHTPKSKCKGFAKPWKKFGPHTDIMGLAIIGKRLYMTSFMGTAGKGGEVLSMPLNGHGAVKPVLGELAPVPIVGLGANRGRLYVGDLAGRVFQVKP